MSKRMNIMLAKPLDQDKLKRYTIPYLVQPKLNGDRCLAYIGENGNTILKSSQGNTILSVPHIMEDLQNCGIRNVVLDGELYCHGMPHQTIRSIVSRTVNFHPEFTKISYHVFDMKNARSQLVRFKTLLEMNELNNTDYVHKVLTIQCINISETVSSLGNFISAGYEGIIVRNPSGFYRDSRTDNMMKFKPTKQDIYRITGWNEEISIHGNPKNTLGSFICTADSGISDSFMCGTGPMLTKERRKQLWNMKDELLNRVLTVKYQQLSIRGVPIFPVAMEISDKVFTMDEWKELKRKEENNE